MTFILTDSSDETQRYQFTLGENVVVTTSTYELYDLVKANSEELVLRDWEELPLDASMNINAEWESLIYYLLNDPSPVIQFPRIAVPGRGLVGENA